VKKQFSGKWLGIYIYIYIIKLSLYKTIRDVYSKKIKSTATLEF